MILCEKEGGGASYYRILVLKCRADFSFSVTVQNPWLLSLPVRFMIQFLRKFLSFHSYFLVRNRLAFQKLEGVFVPHAALRKRVNAVGIGSGCNPGWKVKWRSHTHTEPSNQGGPQSVCRHWLVQLACALGCPSFLWRNQLFVMSRRALMPVPAPASITFSRKERSCNRGLFSGERESMIKKIQMWILRHFKKLQICKKNRIITWCLSRNQSVVSCFAQPMDKLA